jgi:glycogen synthase
MKVLMFGWEFPPQITGGLGTACYGITKGLAKQNVNVLFVVPKTFGNEDKRYTTLQDAGEIPSKYMNITSEDYWENVLYKEMPANLFPYTAPGKEISNPVQSERLITGEYVEKPDFLPFSGKYGTDLWNEIDRYSTVTSIIAGKEDYDIIHAHEWLTFPAAISAKRISSKPLVVHIHATEFDRNNGHIRKEIYDIEKRGMDISDKIITVSNYTRNIVIKEYGIQPGKVITVHNGVEQNNGTEFLKTKKHPDEKTVTFLGRITYQKGPEYFIDAAYKVLQKQNEIKFVMAGSGDLMEKVVRQVERLGISSSVTFPGFLKSDEIRKLFSQTDLYVMPSVSEHFGISPLEALQSKVPVIISKQSGVSEVIRNAIKVDYWDINALSDAIYGVLNYKSLSDLLSLNGSDEVNGLLWENTGKQIFDIYKSLV